MQWLQNKTWTLGLAIFSMMFGAGNLIYPLVVGMSAGPKLAIGMSGFLLTATLLPLLGLIAMILFDGNFEAFFHRVGKIPGDLLILASMIIIGPMIGIPRITTLSHTMIAPFLPYFNHIHFITSFIFGLIFLSITFAASYKESRVMDILGKIISPTLLICLAIIIFKGIITGNSIVPCSVSSWQLFRENFIRGYETLDLLAMIFFASMALKILKRTAGPHTSARQLSLLGLKAGLIGAGLLCIVYIGMGMLSMYHSCGFFHLGAGELFREISFRVLGSWGAGVIALCVLMACLSTAIALSAVVGEYTQKVIFGGAISYITAVILVLLSSLPLCVVGLNAVLRLTAGPIVYIGYPVIIMLTLCNIAYKLIGFKPIKVPVLITFIIALVMYLK